METEKKYIVVTERPARTKRAVFAAACELGEAIKSHPNPAPHIVPTDVAPLVLHELRHAKRHVGPTMFGVIENPNGQLIGAWTVDIKPETPVQAIAVLTAPGDLHMSVSDWTGALANAHMMIRCADPHTSAQGVLIFNHLLERRDAAYQSPIIEVHAGESASGAWVVTPIVLGKI